MSPTEGTNVIFLGGTLARQGGKMPPPPLRPTAPGASPRELRGVPGGGRPSPPEAAGRKSCAPPISEISLT